MNYYKRTSETKNCTVFKVMQVTQQYLNCKKDVEKICWSIKKLISSTEKVLVEVIPADKTEKIREQYQYCLKHTISIALDEVDKLIVKHNVTDEEEIETLREEITNLLDDVDILFNQG